MAEREISGLALQNGKGVLGSPKTHRDGAERRFQSRSREIPGLAMERGSGAVAHTENRNATGGHPRRYPSMKVDQSGLALEHGESDISHPSNRDPSLSRQPRKPPMANMVHMRRTPEERMSANMPILSDDTNHGMCFELCGPELDKLELDDMPERGDLLHFTCMAQVVGINHDTMGKRVRLEIIGMSIENESTEDAGMDDEERMERRYGGDDDD